MKKIEDIIRDDLTAGPMPEGMSELVGALRKRYPQAMRAVVYYGSCRRRADNTEGLVDLLAVVSDYRACHGKGLSEFANRLLPPNVYYLEAGEEDERYRCKYAVVSLDDFSRRCRGGLDGYFWARFAQPCRLAWSAGQAIDKAIADARLAAVTTFARQAAPLMVGYELDAAAFWSQALSESYRCELRPERDHAVRELVDSDIDYWRAVSTAVLPGVPGVAAIGPDRYRIDAADRTVRRARREWRARRVWGKTLNLVRLFKAAGTFTNGVDYILWKIERHSGVHVEITPVMRRFPRLATMGLAWRLWRMGGFR